MHVWVSAAPISLTPSAMRTNWKEYSTTDNVGVHRQFYDFEEWLAKHGPSLLSACTPLPQVGSPCAAIQHEHVLSQHGVCMLQQLHRPFACVAQWWIPKDTAAIHLTPQRY